MFTRSLCGDPETGRRKPEILRLAPFLYGKCNENGESRGSPMGGRGAQNPGRRPNRMENGESRGSAMEGGKAQTGRGNTLDICHFVKKMHKKNKGITKKYNFSALRGKNCRLCYQNASREEASARRPAGGPGAAAEGCGASVFCKISS